jgi:hypothetical protein
MGKSKAEYFNQHIASSTHQTHQRKTLKNVRVLVMHLSVFSCYLHEFLVLAYSNLLNYNFSCNFGHLKQPKRHLRHFYVIMATSS